MFKQIGEQYDLQEAVALIIFCDHAAATGNKNFRVGYVHFINCLRPIVLNNLYHPLRRYSEREAKMYCFN
ncbi:MAG: hypothetical protein AUG51_17065 [Acidobacteria bacterium 13_1_20CM_3_53_8]|nr:MAG: hypothetical protein AUG51_17065 [Acidobacteria bacterium 13_1_20CM_3_53_8]